MEKEPKNGEMALCMLAPIWIMRSMARDSSFSRMVPRTTVNGKMGSSMAMDFVLRLTEIGIQRLRLEETIWKFKKGSGSMEKSERSIMTSFLTRKSENSDKSSRKC